MINSDNFRGAVFMSVSMAAFVLNDAIIKIAAENLGFFQVIFIRGLITTTLIGALAYYKKASFKNIGKADWKIISIRLIGELGSTFCFLMALFNMPLANATAILQAVPLAVTLAAAMFLGEIVGWRRYLAIMVGFIGVLIIVRPGSDGFNEYSIWAIAAVGFIVLRDLSTRHLSSHVPSTLVAFITSLGLTVIGGILSPTTQWQPVSQENFLLLGAAAIFIIFGYLFGIMTMRVGEIGFISPFRYTVLIWAIILGYFVFGDIPDDWTIFGSAVIVITGCYTFYRERKIARQILSKI